MRSDSVIRTHLHTQVEQSIVMAFIHTCNIHNFVYFTLSLKFVFLQQNLSSLWQFSLQLFCTFVKEHKKLLARYSDLGSHSECEDYGRSLHSDMRSISWSRIVPPLRTILWRVGHHPRIFYALIGFTLRVKLTY